MTDYEMLSLLISLLALVISMVSLHGQRKLQKEANDLQRNSSQLSGLQVEAFKQEALVKKAADVRLSLEGRGTKSFLRISNHGYATAHSVTLTALEGEFAEKLLSHRHTQDRLPLPQLGSGEYALLPAIHYVEFHGKASIRITWKDDSGDRSSDVALTL